MVDTAKRMQAMRGRRRAAGLREVRLFVPDARTQATRDHVAMHVNRLAAGAETDALNWIDTVSEFDETR